MNEINMGATAIGTGITADPRFAEAVRRHLEDVTGLVMETAPDLIEATADAGIFMTLSGTLKRAAVKLSKICNDLRLLSSGPQAGFGEISLPARQAGSSIMPGKVNPVIPEVVNQVAFSVIGADATVTAAAEAGQLQLNAFEPVIAHSLLQSLAWMTNACTTLRINCIDGITANTDRLSSQVESSVGVVTALTPYIGYAAAAALAHTALTTNASIAELVVSAGLLSEEEVASVLSPERLSGVVPISGAIALPRISSPSSCRKPSREPTGRSDRALVVLDELVVGFLDPFLGVDRGRAERAPLRREARRARRPGSVRTRCRSRDPWLSPLGRRTSILPRAREHVKHGCHADDMIEERVEAPPRVSWALLPAGLVSASAIMLFGFQLSGMGAPRARRRRRPRLPARDRELGIDLLLIGIGVAIVSTTSVEADVAWGSFIRIGTVLGARCAPSRSSIDRFLLTRHVIRFPWRSPREEDQARDRLPVRGAASSAG